MKLTVKPRKTVTKEDFISYALPNSRFIALDGFVAAPPFRHIMPHGYVINFDHHTGGDRLSMRSTSGQVLMALKLGLASQLENAEVFVNDCDQDVCLATWLLKHPQRVVDTSEPILNRLVWAEDVIDATGGGYPFPQNSQLLEAMQWIFEPYEKARPRVPTMDEDEQRAVIESVWTRIDDHLLGAGERKPADPAVSYSHYLPTTGDVAMVREWAPGSRRSMSRHGIKAFVSVEKLTEVLWSYKIGALSPFTYFPLPTIYAALNAEEALKYVGLGQPWSAAQGWGGSDVIGGGPRSGSLLSPEEVRAIVARVMTEGSNAKKDWGSCLHR